MSQVDKSEGQVGMKKKSYWRSFGQLVKSKTYNQFLHKEFQEGASELSDPSRRRFMKLMGASAALAGVAGCGIRKPVQKIRPYAKMPEDLIPGKANFYATTMALGKSATGLLVESHEGRPTKIEGNPLHSVSGGSSSVFHQASILDLYDPDRLKFPSFQGVSKGKDDVRVFLNKVGKEFRKNKGEGLGILAQEEVSPTYYYLLSILKKVFPKLRVYRYSPVNIDSELEGVKKALGSSLYPLYDFEKANVVVSLDSDFIGNDVSRMENESGFSKRRDPDHKKGMNRLYVFENQYTITGGKADHRFRLKAGQIEGLSLVFASELIKQVGSVGLSSGFVESIHAKAKSHQGLIEKKVLRAIVKDVLKNRRRSIFVAGSKQSASVHAVVVVINQLLGNVNNTVSYVEVPFANYKVNRKSNARSIESLVDRIDSGKLGTLLILGGNPRFDAPSNFNFGPKLKKLKSSLHLTVSKNETSELCDWIVPMSHFLESWGDATSINGVSSLVQPLISPMYDSLSSIELINHLLGYKRSAYATVRKVWRSDYKSIDLFESKWKKWLHQGVISDQKNIVKSIELNSDLIGSLIQSIKVVKGDDIEVVFQADYSVYDGRFINNGWLQELPDPITKLTWDNAALVSPATAKKLGLPGLKGVKDIETVFENPLDVMSLKVGHKSLDIAFLVIPGHADNSISLFLGYGRKQVGRVGENSGFNTYYIRSSETPWIVPSAKVTTTGKTYTLATTQEHGSMEGRPLFAEATMAEYEKHPNFAKEMEHFPPMESLWEEHKYDTGNQWGMTIDLSKCSGCNACVIGCQAENNIPIVGKEEVLNGREMHWIRLDRYFEGDKGEENPRMVQQPMTCLQCENAPCEQVCPVAATTHSEDGLNQMTYNRCVGTRYCSNNCPVKVRRFNFFDYHQRNPQAVKKNREHLFDYFKEPDKSVQMQFNPDVTVRMRGVMEKCTYCVQRIQKAKIDAKLESRDIKDGEIVPACGQACSAGAIVFGDINDPNSQVSKLKKKQRDYEILKGLHLKARTSYIAAILNPNPELEKSKSHAYHKGAH